MNYLRNHSGIIKATLQARANAVKERKSYEQLKLRVKQHKVSMDRLQGQIETLRAEREKLRNAQTALGEVTMVPWLKQTVIKVNICKKKKVTTHNVGYTEFVCTFLRIMYSTE